MLHYHRLFTNQHEDWPISDVEDFGRHLSFPSSLVSFLFKWHCLFLHSLIRSVPFEVHDDEIVDLVDLFVDFHWWFNLSRRDRRFHKRLAWIARWERQCVQSTRAVSFPVRIVVSGRKAHVYVIDCSPSDYYECESIEDIAENETRACQVNPSSSFSSLLIDVLSRRRRTVVVSAERNTVKFNTRGSVVESIRESNVTAIVRLLSTMFRVSNIRRIIFSPLFSIRSFSVCSLSIDLPLATLASLLARWSHSADSVCGGWSISCYSSRANSCLMTIPIGLFNIDSSTLESFFVNSLSVFVHWCFVSWKRTGLIRRWLLSNHLHQWFTLHVWRTPVVSPLETSRDAGIVLWLRMVLIFSVLTVILVWPSMTWRRFLSRTLVERTVIDLTWDRYHSSPSNVRSSHPHSLLISSKLVGIRWTHRIFSVFILNPTHSQLVGDWTGFEMTYTPWIVHHLFLLSTKIMRHSVTSNTRTKKSKTENENSNLVHWFFSCAATFESECEAIHFQDELIETFLHLRLPLFLGNWTDAQLMN